MSSSLTFLLSSPVSEIIYSVDLLFSVTEKVLLNESILELKLSPPWSAFRVLKWSFFNHLSYQSSEIWFSNFKTGNIYSVNIKTEIQNQSEESLVGASIIQEMMEQNVKQYRRANLQISKASCISQIVPSFISYSAHHARNTLLNRVKARN